MILTIRTDKPDAEISLYVAEGDQLATHTWYAHRSLADTLLGEIRDLLATQQKTFADLTGVIVFRGPGSFTGLRIGISVANALAYGQEIPIVGALGNEWVASGLRLLKNQASDKIVTPEYGAEAHITLPKK
jgi:tRNA threonylcarbamoyladenosine biosynthesis protein TsaB